MRRRAIALALGFCTLCCFPIVRGPKHDLAIRGSCWIEVPAEWTPAPPELGYRSDSARVAMLVLGPALTDPELAMLFGSGLRCAVLDATLFQTDMTMFIGMGEGYDVYSGQTNADGSMLSLWRQYTTAVAIMADGNWPPPRFRPSLPISISGDRIVLGDATFVPFPAEYPDLQRRFLEITTGVLGIPVKCEEPIRGGTGNHGETR